MPKYEYTPEDALALLMKKLEEESPELAERARIAINAGEDVQAEESLRSSKGRRSRKRYYRKNQSYSAAKALDVALTTLRSHLIESRLSINSAHSDLTMVGLCPPKPLITTAPFDNLSLAPLARKSWDVDDKSAAIKIGEPKTIIIEAEPETVRIKTEYHDITIEPVDDDELVTLRATFAHLENLLNFQEEQDGNSY